MPKTKSDKSTIPPGNLIMIVIFNLIYLIIGSYVLLGVLKLGDGVLDVYGLDANFLELRSDEDFILYDRHEL